MFKQAHWMTVALLSGMALAACDRPSSPAETQRDMAEAAREASGDVADAKHEAREANASNMKNSAEAQEDVALAQAKSDYKVGIESCEAQTGDARERCKETAQSTLNTAQARADKVRDQQNAIADSIKP